MASLDFRHDKRIGTAERELLRTFCASLDSEIVRLANDLGIKVFEEELMPYESGYLEHDPTCGSRSGFKIIINRSHSIERRRFTIAHEIAHFLLHREDAKKWKAHRAAEEEYDPFVYLNDWDQSHEVEANRFAGALLMPPNLFKPAFMRLDGRIDQLARLFGVSVASATIRCHELGLNL